MPIDPRAIEAARRHLAEFEADNPDDYEDYENHEPAMIARVLLAAAQEREEWRPFDGSEPRDEVIWVYCPPREGLPALISQCQWHEDAGFCVDEIREPALWQYLVAPSPPTLSPRGEREGE